MYGFNGDVFVAVSAAQTGFGLIARSNALHNIVITDSPPKCCSCTHANNTRLLGG